MAKVKFTSALKTFFPDLNELEVNASSVNEAIKEVDSAFPGMSNYLLEEDGSLRKHVNIFVDDSLIHDRSGLSDKVEDRNEILVFQALSGG